jgi:transcriptional regulator with PAS, ATPase and Fis domain
MAALTAVTGLPSPWPSPLAFPEGYVPGHSPVMRTLYADIRGLAATDLPILFLGETGVGKEQLAQALHASSPRHGGPFVAVNCAAIPADLLEAEMFGIGKGVATGVSERPGKFQLAHQGTLFLDEIGDMSPALQAKLLRAVQGREVQPVGCAPVRVDVRVVTATNSDLDLKMEAGQFRRDLYYRVAGFVLRVPSLRERREDIPELVRRLLATFAREAGRPAPSVTPEALSALVAYAWPGNVRELEHEARRLVYVCNGRPVDVAMLPDHLLVSDGAPAVAASSLALERHVEQLERRLLRAALARAHGRRSVAAQILGISRNGLAMKMERLGLA